MMAPRAYVHFFVGLGMESGEFECKYNDLEYLIHQYQEMEDNESSEGPEVINEEE